MHAFARVTVCVCVGGGGVGAIKQGGAPLSGEGGGHLPQMPPYGDATVPIIDDVFEVIKLL